MNPTEITKTIQDTPKRGTMTYRKSKIHKGKFAGKGTVWAEVLLNGKVVWAEQVPHEINDAQMFSLAAMVRKTLTGEE